MIKFTRAYVDSSNEVHATLEQAQEAEIINVLYGTDTVRTDLMHDVASRIVKAKSAIMDALTMNDSSRPGARGQKKSRKSKPTDAQLPLKENAA